MKKLHLILMALILGPNLSNAQTVKSDMIDITLAFNENKPGDTLYFAWSNSFFSFYDEWTSNVQKGVVDVSGLCRFQVPVKQQHGRFKISKKFDLDTSLFDSGKMQDLNAVVNEYFWDAGDKFMVKVEKYKSSGRNQISPNYDFHYVFTGQGAPKNTVRFRVDSTFYKSSSGGLYHDLPFDQDMNYHDGLDDQRKAALLVLEKYKPGLSDLYFRLIRADITFRGPAVRFDGIKRYFDKHVKDNPQMLARFKVIYNQVIVDSLRAFIDPQSQTCVSFLRHKANFDDYLLYGDNNPDRVFSVLNNTYQGILRDRLLTLMLSSKPSENFGNLLATALGQGQDPASLYKLEKLKKRSSQAVPFPFILPDVNGNYVKLSDFKGKVVFVDFWFTGCGGCTMYYQKVLSKVEQHFDDKDVVFVTINTDIGKPLWLKSIKSGKYVSDKSVNLYTGGKGDKHPAITHYNFNSYPALLLIDRAGKIKEFNTENLAKRDPDNLIRVLEGAVGK